MVNDLLGRPLDSTAVVVLSLAYVTVESVLVYDMRLIQARTGRFTTAVATAARGLTLPSWIRYAHAIGWLLLISIAVLNWRFAIALYLVLYVLRVLPVLERLGELLGRPLLIPDHDAAQRDIQTRLAENEAALSRARQDYEEAIHLMRPGATPHDFVPAFRTWWLRSENQEASLGDALEGYVEEYDLYEQRDPQEPQGVTLARSILKVLATANLSFEGDDDALLFQYTTSLRMRIRAYEARAGGDRPCRNDPDSSLPDG